MDTRDIKFWEWAKRDRSHWFNVYGHVQSDYEMRCELAQNAWRAGWNQGAMSAHGINEQDIAETMPPRQGH